jgi:hypothetical protein
MSYSTKTAAQNTRIAPCRIALIRQMIAEICGTLLPAA